MLAPGLSPAVLPDPLAAEVPPSREVIEVLTWISLSFVSTQLQNIRYNSGKNSLVRRSGPLSTPRMSYYCGGRPPASRHLLEVVGMLLQCLRGLRWEDNHQPFPAPNDLRLLFRLRTAHHNSEYTQLRYVCSHASSVTHFLSGLHNGHCVTALYERA